MNYDTKPSHLRKQWIYGFPTWFWKTTKPLSWVYPKWINKFWLKTKNRVWKFWYPWQKFLIVQCLKTGRCLSLLLNVLNRTYLQWYSHFFNPGVCLLVEMLISMSFPSTTKFFSRTKMDVYWILLVYNESKNKIKLEYCDFKSTNSWC